MDSVKSKMNNLIDSMKEQLFEMGDAIYDHPEIGLQEVFASKLLEDWLENHGFLVERGLGSMPTAFRAVYEQGTGVLLFLFLTPRFEKFFSRFFVLMYFI